MLSLPQHFESITLLITHFNRSHSLERLLQSLETLKLSFGEIIVSDGGSNGEHFEAVLQQKERYSFTLLSTSVNKGLGNSINVGQDFSKTPYLLYVQEDFVPLPAFRQALANGLNLMDEESEWDIVRFYAFPWAKYPYLKNYKKGFSRMQFNLAPWYINHHKFYLYSDHPHLKRNTFSDKFGRYLETLSGDTTEMSMCRSFLKNHGKGLFYNDYKDLFEHVNSAEEPGQYRPVNQASRKLSEIPWVYNAYLKYKTMKETFSYVLAK
ncbi:glycosyltransferase family 2 protein [Siphonobacter curvatus]|uniref:Glycosyl transferase family 2 n=1 Tax=Siphonobacter curvatus TaxID=2094562 RepID=A0A2S7IEZ4_9BACT|nr:glycosyltransferase [Siphonobacter curvatus]PQA53216.1 glycosyl transferase family 2 [Siphonobacter curvatus]